MGHPYYEVIDNSTDFEMKMRRLIKAVADKLSIPHAEEICQAVKLKFLLAGTMPELEQWPVKFRDFEVEHDYLPCYQNGPQARIRRRGRHGEWEDLEDWPIFCLLIDGVMLVGKYMYTHTIRKSVDQRVETRTNISRQIYEELLIQVNKHTVFSPLRNSFINTSCRPTNRGTLPSERPGGVSIGTINIIRWTSTSVPTQG